MSGVNWQGLLHALLAGLELLVILRVAVDALPMRVHGAPTRFVYEASEPLLRPLRPLCRRKATGWRDLSPAAALLTLGGVHFVLYILNM